MREESKGPRGEEEEEEGGAAEAVLLPPLLLLFSSTELPHASAYAHSPQECLPDAYWCCRPLDYETDSARAARALAATANGVAAAAAAADSGHAGCSSEAEEVDLAAPGSARRIELF